MKTKVLLWVVIGVLFVVALFLVFKAGTVSTEAVQMGGNIAKTAALSSGGMVGGC